MNSVVSETASEPLLFAWDSPGRAKFAIILFVVLSLIAHALCFYVFQIVYPPTVAILPAPARVTLITPGSEDGRRLLRWMDAEDPALAFTTYRPREATLPALPTAEHVPSYYAVEPTLQEIPPIKRDLSIPSCHPVGAVKLGHPKSTRAMPGVKTSVSFSNEFDVFGVPVVAETKFTASNLETPATIRFRVAVNNFGEIRYCLPMDSSGDPALDEQGRLYVLRCRFSEAARSTDKADSFLTWGIATVQWGSDIARSQLQPAASVPE